MPTGTTKCSWWPKRFCASTALWSGSRQQHIRELQQNEFTKLQKKRPPLENSSKRKFCSSIQNCEKPYEKQPSETLSNPSTWSHRTSCNEQKNKNSLAEAIPSCYWHFAGMFSSSRHQSGCIIDVEYFPYDIQTCHLKLGSWSYDGGKVPFWPKSEKKSSKAQWHLYVAISKLATLLSVSHT